MTYLSSIIRSSDYLTEAVIVTGGRTRRFTPTQLSGEVEKTHLEDVASQKAQLETARQQTERIVAEAEARVEAIELEATARGYEEGLAQGLKAAEQQMSVHLEAIAEMARKAAIDHEQMIRSVQPELVALALAIAAKVIRREVSVDPSLVLSVVESALQRMPLENQVRILVNPEDLDLVTARWTGLAGSVSLGCEVDVAGDERVERGGCIVESRGGMLDSRIETQLARIAEAFEIDP